MDSSFESMNIVYALASMCPSNRSNWTPFITILNNFQGSSHAEDHHDFIDICELIHKNLEWPLEEKLILTLYLSFAKRKFTNFENETSVPTSISVILSKHDIPQDTVFERFWASCTPTFLTFARGKKWNDLPQNSLLQVSTITKKAANFRLCLSTDLTWSCSYFRSQMLTFAAHFPVSLIKLLNSKICLSTQEPLMLLILLLKYQRGKNWPSGHCFSGNVEFFQRLIW